MTIDFDAVIWVDESNPDFDPDTDPKLDAVNLQRYEDVVMSLISAVESTEGDVASLSTGLTTAEDDITDLQTTLNGWQPISATLTYSSADGHTFVASTSADLTGSIDVGMRFKLTQTTTKFFIVTAISSTTITLYGGTDYTLANAAVTAPSFSNVKAPLGFPLDQTKWTETMTDTSDRTQSTPVSGTWYNLGSLSLAIPIGAWGVEWEATSEDGRSTTGDLGHSMTFSTANNSESDRDFTSHARATSALAGFRVTHYRRKVLVLAVKTSYFLNIKATNTVDSVSILGATGGTTIIRAVCLYL